MYAEVQVPYIFILYFPYIFILYFHRILLQVKKSSKNN